MGAVAMRRREGLKVSTTGIPAHAAPASGRPAAAAVAPTASGAAAAPPAPAERAPRLLFLVTEDWYFVSHRLRLAMAARAAGYEVHVATRETESGDAIRAAGLTLHRLDWRRGGGSPGPELAALRRIVRLYAALRPDVVHHVALKPVIYGAFAARLARVGAAVNAIAGLGFVFTERSLKARLLRPPLLAAMRALLNRPGWVTLFQNPDDRELMVRRGVVHRARARLIRGAGVDTQRLRPLPEPADGPVTIAVASRMLRFKGIGDLVEASRILQGRGVEHRLLLAGAPDATNPAAIPEAELTRWAEAPRIEWLGPVADIGEVWARAHIGALASHGGEGLPKTLLEAAACGRPIVATDISGSREVVRHGETGLLVPPRRPDALADALARLIGDPALRRRFGASGRALVEAELSLGAVTDATLALYRELEGGGRPG